MEFLCISFVVLFFGGLTFLGYRKAKQTRETLERLTEELQSHEELGAEARSRLLELGTFQRKKGKNSSVRYWTIKVLVDLPEDLAIERAGPLALIASQFGKTWDVETGDAVFDQAFRLTASDEVALVSRLTPQVRDLFLRGVAGGTFAVAKGRLRWAAKGFPKRADLVEPPARVVLDLAAQLDGEASVEARLLARVLDDEERDEVRRRCQAWLLERAPSSPEARMAQAVEVGASAAEDGLPLVVRTAAETVLRDLAQPDTQHAVVKFLATFSIANRVHPVVEDALLKALRSPEPTVQVLAATGLARSGAERSVGPLEALAATTQDSELRAAVDEALRQVQIRVRGAEAGQVSLAVSSADLGQVSLATPAED